MYCVLAARTVPGTVQAPYLQQPAAVSSVGGWARRTTFYSGELTAIPRTVLRVRVIVHSTMCYYVHNIDIIPPYVHRYIVSEQICTYVQYICLMYTLLPVHTERSTNQYCKFRYRTSYMYRIFVCKSIVHVPRTIYAYEEFPGF